MAHDIAPLKHHSETPSGGGLVIPSWDQIVAEIAELSCSGRIRSIIRLGVDPDDLRQSVAVLLIEKLSAETSVRVLFGQEDKRRAYIASCLHNIGRSMLRGPRPMSLDQSDMPTGEGAQAREPGPSDRVDLVDLIGSVLSSVQRDTHAWLAVRVLTGIETLEHYAATSGLSERTARRHLVLGTLELKTLAEQQTES